MIVWDDIRSATPFILFAGHPGHKGHPFGTENLAIRAQYRSYELTNQTDRYVINGDVAASPDRSWTVVTPSAGAPYGHATANVYDHGTKRFTASAAYDIGDLTLEGQLRRSQADVWKLWVNALRQKVDGFMDITARESGSFYTPGRTTVVPAGTGGAQDIDLWDDTTRTTIAAQLDYGLTRAWTLSAGYAYEKYEFGDAYTAGDLLMPQSVLLFLKSNDGGYDANVLYGRLSYRF